MRGSGLRRVAVAATGLLAGSLLVATATAASAKTPSHANGAGAAAVRAVSQTDLGPNVLVFDPSMPQAQIQSAVDTIATQQLTNQFGTQRYALLFKPGTYGSATDPLNFQVGYYTEVAGLGLNPDDVVINGSVNVYNQCDANNSCIALDNFWRSLSNLSINVTNPAGAGCHAGDFWAVSQAAPLRRVHVTGVFTLMDYCTQPSFASGGFIADSRFDGASVVNGSQQQFVVRNSTLDGWGNGVWNQVFAGVVNAPAQCFPAQTSCGGPVHDRRRDTGEPGEALPLRGRHRRVPRLRAPGGHAVHGGVLVGRVHPGPLHPAVELLHRHPGGFGRDSEPAAGPGPQPAAHPGCLRRRPDHRRQPGRHGRARAGSGHADRRWRGRSGGGRQRSRGRSSRASFSTREPRTHPC